MTSLPCSRIHFYFFYHSLLALNIAELKPKTSNNLLKTRSLTALYGLIFVTGKAPFNRITTMYIDDLQKAIKAKMIELELAYDLQKSHSEILRIYKDLKELRYRLVQAELSSVIQENVAGDIDD